MPGNRYSSRVASSLRAAAGRCTHAALAAGGCDNRARLHRRSSTWLRAALNEAVFAGALFHRLHLARRHSSLN